MTPEEVRVALVAPSAAERIDAGRAEIDQLDAEIAALVRRRARVSSEVQAARASRGGGVVEPGREAVVQQRYADALGAHGPAVADAVLLVCRGPDPT